MLYRIYNKCFEYGPENRGRMSLELLNLFEDEMKLHNIRSPIPHQTIPTPLTDFQANLSFQHLNTRNLLLFGCCCCFIFCLNDKIKNRNNSNNETTKDKHKAKEKWGERERGKEKGNNSLNDSQV